MALSVMTWNVENLFPQGPGDPQEEIDRYQAKLDLLAGTVTVLNPDVIALQELGPGALADLRQRLPTYTDLHEGVPEPAVFPRSPGRRRTARPDPRLGGPFPAHGWGPPRFARR